ncbi:MAG: amidohydrolase family protein [Nitrospinota bacterium]
MIVDIHTHLYPKTFIPRLQEFSAKYEYEITFNREGLPIIYRNGMDYGPIVEPAFDPAERIPKLDEAGIDMQLLTIGFPAADLLRPEDGVPLAREINDELADICRRHPDRFSAMATAYMKEPEEAPKELERAVRELGLKGLFTFTNIDGIPASDRRFRPVLAKAAELDVPVIFHPMVGAKHELLKGHHFGALIGFMFEITLHYSTLIYQGIYEEFPNLKLVATHLGGALPFLAERISWGYNYPDTEHNIPKNPHEYYKLMYFDTTSFYTPALDCTHVLAGPDRMLLGSDFPFRIGDLGRAVRSIREWDRPENEKKRVLGENAARLFKLKG